MGKSKRIRELERNFMWPVSELSGTIFEDWVDSRVRREFNLLLDYLGLEIVEQKPARTLGKAPTKPKGKSK